MIARHHASAGPRRAALLLRCYARYAHALGGPFETFAHAIEKAGHYAEATGQIDAVPPPLLPKLPVTVNGEWGGIVGHARVARIQAPGGAAYVVFNDEMCVGLMASAVEAMASGDPDRICGLGFETVSFVVPGFGTVGRSQAGQIVGVKD